MIEAKLGRYVAEWYSGENDDTGKAKLITGTSQQTWSVEQVHENRNVRAPARRGDRRHPWLAGIKAAKIARDDIDNRNCRSRARVPQLWPAASGGRTGAALAARARSRSAARSDAGAWRFSPRQPHHRPR